MIKPNGSSFIGKNVDGKMQGFVYKFKSIYEMLIDETFQSVKDMEEEEAEPEDAPLPTNPSIYREEEEIEGTGFECEYDGTRKSVYYGKFSKSKFNRQKEWERMCVPKQKLLLLWKLEREQEERRFHCCIGEGHHCDKI